MKSYEIDKRKKKRLRSKGYKLLKEWKETKWKRFFFAYMMWALPFIVWGMTALYMRYVLHYDSQDTADAIVYFGLTAIFTFPIGIFYHKHLFNCVYIYKYEYIGDESLITTQEGIQYSYDELASDWAHEIFIKYEDIHKIEKHNRRQFLELDCGYYHQYIVNGNRTANKEIYVDDRKFKICIALWWKDNEGLMKELEERTGKKIIEMDY